MSVLDRSVRVIEINHDKLHMHRLPPSDFTEVYRVKLALSLVASLCYCVFSKPLDNVNVSIRFLVKFRGVVLILKGAILYHLKFL